MKTSKVQISLLQLSKIIHCPFESDEVKNFYFIDKEFCDLVILSGSLIKKNLSLHLLSPLIVRQKMEGGRIMILIHR